MTFSVAHFAGRTEIFHTRCNVLFLHVTAIPDASATCHVEVELGARIDRINRPVVQLARPPASDQILPAEWVEWRMVLKIEAVSKMERFAGKDLQFTVDLVGVHFTSRIKSNRHSAACGETIFHVPCSPVDGHGFSSATDFRLSPLTGGFWKCSLILEPPMRIEGELWFIARLQFREATGVFF